jgi:3-hydroxyethyl bacteriochlorophyllide a dehydrogenase
LSRLDLAEPGEADVVVDVAWSGISTGTERLLWSGRMPPFPGMGYPLVPGYESVGRIAAAGSASGRSVGETVFVPGSTGFRNARGLFGGAASRLVAAGARVVPIDAALGDLGVLIALAATAHHAFPIDAPQPELIVGHGVLGRLMARIAVAAGAAPVVWETNPARRGGAHGYAVYDPAEDPRKDYRIIADVSGDAAILDALVARLAPGGEIVLAGFYSDRLSFAFPPAFMREARLRIAAEWKPADLVSVSALIAAHRLSLDGLITHRAPARDAEAAYRTAFTDPACLKMVLDWREVQ